MRFMREGGYRTAISSKGKSFHEDGRGVIEAFQCVIVCSLDEEEGETKLSNEMVVFKFQI